MMHRATFVWLSCRLTMLWIFASFCNVPEVSWIRLNSKYSHKSPLDAHMCQWSQSWFIHSGSNHSMIGNTSPHFVNRCFWWHIHSTPFEGRLTLDVYRVRFCEIHCGISVSSEPLPSPPEAQIVDRTMLTSLSHLAPSDCANSPLQPCSPPPPLGFMHAAIQRLGKFDRIAWDEAKQDQLGIEFSLQSKPTDCIWFPRGLPGIPGDGDLCSGFSKAHPYTNTRVCNSKHIGCIPVKKKQVNGHNAQSVYCMLWPAQTSHDRKNKLVSRYKF